MTQTAEPGNLYNSADRAGVRPLVQSRKGTIERHQITSQIRSLALQALAFTLLASLSGKSRAATAPDPSKAHDPPQSENRLGRNVERDD